MGCVLYEQRLDQTAENSVSKLCVEINTAHVERNFLQSSVLFEIHFNKTGKNVQKGDSVKCDHEVLQRVTSKCCLTLMKDLEQLHQHHQTLKWWNNLSVYGSSGARPPGELRPVHAEEP